MNHAKLFYPPFLLLLSMGMLSGQRCGTPVIKPLDSRIIGGTTATKGSWPWQVSIGLRRSTWFGTTIDHICGGTILDEYTILTAAHCVTDPDTRKYLIRAGKHDLTQIESTEQISEVWYIKTHERYAVSTDEHDIAIVVLQTPLKFTAEVSPICLPLIGDDPQPYSFGTVTGWGETEPQEWKSGRAISTLLQQVSLPIIPRYRCLDFYPGVITNEMYCAGLEQGGQDACQADSGGPMVQRANDGTYYQVGIVSWGYGCAQPGQPGVYVRLGSYVQWINSARMQLKAKKALVKEP